MERNKIINSTVGEIVTEDFRAASVFKEAGIDFCCGGNKNFDLACAEKRIDPRLLSEKLQELELNPDNSDNNFKDWELGFLCDYIVNTHHRYVLKNLPELVNYTNKIASVHKETHNELVQVASLFLLINKELLQHLKNEEEVLFPAIKQVLLNGAPKAKAIIVSETARMSGEHEFAGGTMDRINELTNNYNVPSDGCNTYNIAYKLLKQFEDDLHTHVHIENNILYPKALKLTY